MHASIARIARVAAMLAALSALKLAAAAKDAGSGNADIVAVTLQSTGWLPVKAAGPYVQLGSYRIWVSSHLGKPAKVLPDGTWVYQGFKPEDSDAEGALLVSFKQGQVSDLRLVTPAVLTALLTRAHPPVGTLIAQRK